MNAGAVVGEHDASHDAHDLGSLGALAIGLLDGAAAAAAQHQVSTCSACHREYTELEKVVVALHAAEREMLDDGEPQDQDLVERAIAAAHAEVAQLHPTQQVLPDQAPEQQRREPPATVTPLPVRDPLRAGRGPARRQSLLVAAAVITAAALLGTGMLIGGSGTTSGTSVTASAVALDGSASGMTMSAWVTPAAGWVRVRVAVRGIPAGTPCTIVVTGRDGSTSVAGQWLASAQGQSSGTTVEGAAIVELAQLQTITILDDQGRTLITARA